MLHIPMDIVNSSFLSKLAHWHIGTLFLFFNNLIMSKNVSPSVCGKARGGAFMVRRINPSVLVCSGSNERRTLVLP